MFLTTPSEIFKKGILLLTKCMPESAVARERFFSLGGQTRRVGGWQVDVDLIFLLLP